MTGGKRCGICKVTALLAALGAINWGLFGAFQLDLVAKFLGEMTGAARAAYVVIGVAGLLSLASVCNLCPCTKGSCETKS